MAIKELKGNEAVNDLSIGIVVARWNSFITDKLLEGALEVLKNKGFEEDQLVIARCSGAYEIPVTAQKLLEQTDAVITLGAVIRGETPHFEYVCDAVNRGVMRLNLDTGKPVSFGVLTTDTVEQARQRAGEGEQQGNKGSEAALALIDTLSVLREIEKL